MLNNDSWDLGTNEIIILFILLVIVVFFFWLFSKLLKRK
ncbi:Uncharacterised protein [Sphingobacterium mizutaii]|uniref:Uncharacterized protein n=1 Tax=Sphingobacterium mizutaii TaxID=1010 RepID=A0AAJ4X8Q2_9SPHI|nr:hypothetical protein SAMN05192578_11530 [Sphingobacterium mizutaii]SNV42047.1 Uncharacterised protein [Sphingobacterium mizutaii]